MVKVIRFFVIYDEGLSEEKKMRIREAWSRFTEKEKYGYGFLGGKSYTVKEYCEALKNAFLKCLEPPELKKEVRVYAIAGIEREIDPDLVLEYLCGWEKRHEEYLITTIPYFEYMADPDFKKEEEKETLAILGLAGVLSGASLLIKKK
jgi:hypothetical protein